MCGRVSPRLWDTVGNLHGRAWWKQRLGYQAVLSIHLQEKCKIKIKIENRGTVQSSIRRGSASRSTHYHSTYHFNRKGTGALLYTFIEIDKKVPPSHTFITSPSKYKSSYHHVVPNNWNGTAIRCVCSKYTSTCEIPTLFHMLESWKRYLFLAEPRCIAYRQ